MYIYLFFSIQIIYLFNYHFILNEISTVYIDNLQGNEYIFLWAFFEFKIFNFPLNKQGINLHII